MASTLKIDTVTTPDGTGNITFSRPIVADGSNLTNLTAGKILQVVNVIKTDAYATTVTNSWVDVTDMTATTGTLASTSSKVLVQFNFTAKSNSHASFRVVDGSGSNITGFVGDSGGGQYTTFGNCYNDMGTLASNQMSCSLLDSPSSTSAQTYKLQAWRTSSGTIWLNRLERTGTADDDYRFVASITLMEIGA